METILAIASGRSLLEPEIEYRAVVKEKGNLPRNMFISSRSSTEQNRRSNPEQNPDIFRSSRSNSEQNRRTNPEQNRRYAGKPAKLGEPLKPYSSAVRPAHETDLGTGLSRLIGGILPNSYYSRPKFRYPYYDTSGKGYLLYGYGGRDLYEYSVFKPLEGYF